MSVQIIEASWGYCKVQHKEQTFEFGKPHTNRADILLTNDHLQLWDWKNDETFCDTHSPGISEKLIDYMKALGCDEIIISRGYKNVLETQEDVLKYVEQLGMKYQHLNSKDAIQKWNELAGTNDKLGLILHSTC